MYYGHFLPNLIVAFILKKAIDKKWFQKISGCAFSLFIISSNIMDFETTNIPYYSNTNFTFTFNKIFISF